MRLSANVVQTASASQRATGWLLAQVELELRGSDQLDMEFMGRMRVSLMRQPQSVTRINTQDLRQNMQAHLCR
jgi:hypothetical protein